MNHNKVWKSFLKEEQSSRQRAVYRFYMMLGYRTDSVVKRGLDDILAEIRGIPSVTVVTVATRNRKVGEDLYVAGIAIKFVPSYPGVLRSPEEAKSRIVSSIKQVKGVTRIFKLSSSFERID